MTERRKKNRQASKTINFKRNKIAKIIFLKTIALPAITMILGVIFLLFTTIFDYLDAKKISDENQKIVEKIDKIKQKIKQEKAQNIKIQNQLVTQSDKMINPNEVKPLIKKIVDYLTLQNIIYNGQVRINYDEQYQNVLNVEITTDYNSQLLNPKIIKNIFYMVFKNIFYIKNITIKDRQIYMQIYKKV